MADGDASQDEEVQALMRSVAKRLAAGEPPAAVRDDLIARGLDKRLAEQLVQKLALRPGKWERGARGWILRSCGVVVMLAGGLLWLGNQIGFFPTFPFVGTLVVFAGAAIFAIGGGK